MNFVLDASVALAWCFEDEGGDYAINVLKRLRESEAVVTHHWPLEIANGLLTAERRGRVESTEVPALSHLLLSLPIAVDPAERSLSLTASYRLARTHGLTSYDAAYLELATRCGLPLATLDARLAVAAEAEGVGWR